MRPLHAIVAVLAIATMGALVVAGGRAVQRGGDAGGDDQLQAIAEQQIDAPVTSAIPPADKTTKAEPHSRAIDPEAVAPPPLQSEELERIDPRPPLSKLALAMPPKPKMPDDWDGTKLFNPVTSAAGLIEAKGYSVAISGVDIVKQDEICSDNDKSWACGVRARTAFRAFLRGRAVVCKVPPEGGRDLIAAECRIGKQDVGRWLVENGWSRAAKGGPYVDAGEKARTARKGIFGPAPDLSGLPPVPAPPNPAPQASSSILEEVDGVLKPADQPAPDQ